MPLAMFLSWEVVALNLIPAAVGVAGGEAQGSGGATVDLLEVRTLSEYSLDMRQIPATQALQGSCCGQ